MASKDRINQLRAQASRLERNATRKMSRLRHADNPVELTGSKFDYRKGGQAISRMRTRDLEAHIRRLQAFNSRTSRFMPSAEGIVGPREVNRYIKARDAVNRKREKLMETLGNKLTHTGQETYAQKFAKEDVAIRRMANPSTNNPFRQNDDKGVTFRGPDALAKMAKKFERELQPDYDRKRTKKNRETLNKILKVVDQPELVDLIKDMSDYQFDLMWFDPDFMSGEGWLYAQAMGKIKGDHKMSDKQMQVFEDQVGTEKELAARIARHAATQEPAKPKRKGKK